MPEAVLLSLAIKMAASAVLVVLASRAVERSGPLAGALIATLPISAGPNYAFLAAEHGPAFLAQSALTGFAGNAATIAFIAVYALLARHHGVLASLGAAYGVWLAGAGLVARLQPSFATALLLNGAAFALALPLTRRLRSRSGAARPTSRPLDLPLRALAVMTLVAAVVIAGRLLGPGAAGLAAIVPIAMTSVAAILHRRLGGPAAATALAHTLPGMVGFTAALGCLGLTAVSLGSAVALGLALAVCLAWNLGLAALAGVGRGRSSGLDAPQAASDFSPSRPARSTAALAKE